MNISSCVIPVSYFVTQTEGFLFVSAGQMKETCHIWTSGNINPIDSGSLHDHWKKHYGKIFLMGDLHLETK